MRARGTSSCPTAMPWPAASATASGRRRSRPRPRCSSGSRICSASTSPSAARARRRPRSAASRGRSRRRRRTPRSTICTCARRRGLSAELRGRVRPRAYPAAVMDGHALDVLELAAIRERLANHTSFSASRALAEALLPSPDAGEVAARQALCAEALILVEQGPPRMSGAHDVRADAEHAGRGGSLGAEALVAIAETARAALGVRGHLGERSEAVPLLAGRAGGDRRDAHGSSPSGSSARSSSTRRASRTRPRPSSSRCARSSPRRGAARATDCARSRRIPTSSRICRRIS